jgi:hypothetical protein
VRHHDVLATRPLAAGHVDMDRSTRMETVSPVGVASPFHVVRAIVTLAPLDYEEHVRKPAMRIACADVRWSAIRTTDAGTVTRQLDIPDFVLQP